MLDQHHRKITYARFSITDRCNLRCHYCMPAEGIPEKKTHGDILSYEAFLRIGRLMVDLGIRDFKVTGGEPLIRSGAVAFIKALKEVPGVRKVTLTTNGLLLAPYAEDLLAAGVDGINVSLDSLDRDRYADLARRDGLDQVLEGMARLLDRGYQGLKVNTVPLKGWNEADLVALAGLAKDHPLHVRFIELMPIGLGQGGGGISPEEVLTRLESAYGPAQAFTGTLGQGPASYVSFEGFQGKVGFIGALHNKFCDTCNRIRVTSQGVLKGCLQYEGGLRLGDHLEETDEALRVRIAEAIYRKPMGHAFDTESPVSGREVLGMDQLGG